MILAALVAVWQMILQKFVSYEIPCQLQKQAHHQAHGILANRKVVFYPN